MDKWVKCSDRLPTEWGMYLVYYYKPICNSYDMQVIHFDNQRNKFNVQYNDEEVTHWQPLPSKPE